MSERHPASIGEQVKYLAAEFWKAGLVGEDHYRDICAEIDSHPDETPRTSRERIEKQMEMRR